MHSSLGRKKAMNFNVWIYFYLRKELRGANADVFNATRAATSRDRMKVNFAMVIASISLLLRLDLQ
jgi:hypothetical protein